MPLLSLSFSTSALPPSVPVQVEEPCDHLPRLSIESQLAPCVARQIHVRGASCTRLEFLLYCLSAPSLPTADAPQSPNLIS